MKRENILLVLWIIFGFLFVSAVNSILYLIINLLYFGLYELGITFQILKIMIPIITIILYGITAYLLLNRGNLDSRIAGLYLLDFPINLTVVLGIIAFTLHPLAEKLVGYHAEHISKNDNWNSHSYLDFYAWRDFGFIMSKWVLIVFLLVAFLPKLNTLKIRSRDSDISDF